jgi:hypothetical protein
VARLGCCATLGISILLSAVVACDTAGENEGCADGSDPSKCPRSIYSIQDPHAYDTLGIVRRGEDGVPGARVSVAPAAIAARSSTFTATVSTNAIGFYLIQGQVPWLYDLSFVLPGGRDGRTDVFVLRDVAYRYFEPQLDAPARALPRAWTGHVQVQLDAPLVEGHTLLFLAAGDGVYGVTGDLATGLDVYTARFEQTANIRAVEYDAAKGVTSASAYGKGDVITSAGRAAILSLHLDPITDTAAPAFTIDLPPGFVPGSVDIRFNSSRTSDALLASLPWGQTATLPIIPDQGYTYRLRATRADGAISDSGEQNFDLRKETPISLPAPPDVVVPADGATIEAGQTVSAVGSGILEHLFEPETAGAPALRMVGTSMDTTLPDLKALAVDQGTGNYTWTVRRFSTMTSVENMWGADARRYRPVAISAPRALILR